MIALKTFLASEARTKLFKIFKMVSSGEDVVVLNKDTGEKFKISRFQEKKLDKIKILREMGNIGLKTGTPEEIKKVILTKYD